MFSESFEAFDSEVKLADYFHKQFENTTTYHGFGVGCGIVFETGELEDGDVPKNFKYKIRSTVPMWNTKNLFPQFLPAGPTDEGGKRFMFIILSNYSKNIHQFVNNLYNNKIVYVIISAVKC